MQPESKRKEMHPDLQSLMDLLTERGFTCEQLHGMGSSAGTFSVTVDGKKVQVTRLHDTLCATDDIPGLKMIPGFGHGNYSLEIWI